MTAFGNVLATKDPANPRIARITLNRPEKLNAINSQLPGQIRAAVEWAEGDAEVHVVVLEGAGQKVLTLRGAMPREDSARQPLCADIDGFSLHAAVRVEAHDRKRLEQLCRYITRPALSDERVQVNAAGQVELKLKTPWRDGTTHLVMSPREFMQRLAALVPRPLKRVFDIDMQHCPNCGGGELKIIAAILERPVIEKI